MRKEPNKSQLNVLIKTRAKNRLVKIAKKLGTTQTAMIEEMINDKYSEVMK